MRKKGHRKGLTMWMKKYPFRVLAAVLMALICIELYMISSIPDLSAEVAEARTAYEQALLRNRELEAVWMEIENDK